MSKTYKGQTTNSVVELTLQEEAVGAGFDTPTIAWDDTVNGVITQVQGDIPDNWTSTDKVKGPLEIGTSCTSIGSNAFYFCTGLTGDLVIPDSVTTIGSYAFSYCTGLTSDLVIPNSVTSISSYAFNLCSNLTTAYLAPPLANVGSNAFYGSGLTTVYANDAVANGWTLGAGQTVGGKSGVTVIDWTNYPVTP